MDPVRTPRDPPNPHVRSHPRQPPIPRLDLVRSVPRGLDLESPRPNLGGSHEGRGPLSHVLGADDPSQDRGGYGRHSSQPFGNPDVEQTVLRCPTVVAGLFQNAQNWVWSSRVSLVFNESLYFFTTSRSIRSATSE